MFARIHARHVISVLTYQRNQSNNEPRRQRILLIVHCESAIDLRTHLTPQSLAARRAPPATIAAVEGDFIEDQRDDGCWSQSRRCSVQARRRAESFPESEPRYQRIES